MSSSWQAIQRIADRLSPRMAAEFLQAVRALQASIDLTAVARALERGQVSAAKLLIDTSRFPRDLVPAVRVVNEVFAEAGRTALLQLAESGPTITVTLSFTLTNPRAVQWARTNGATLVRRVSDETQQAIRSIIGRAIQEGHPPLEAARSIRQIVGLTERQAHAVINYRFELLGHGLSGERVHVLAERYAAKLRRQRAVLIARTETQQASNAGQLEAWEQARERGLLDTHRLQKTWIVTPDDRLCPRCAPLHGVNAPLDQPFPGTSVRHPPLHPACRCAQGLVRVETTARKVA